MTTQGTKPVLPLQAGRAEIEELGGIFLAVSYLMKEKNSDVIEDDAGRKTTHFCPLDTVALGSVDTLMNPRDEPTTMLLFILRFWMQQGESSDEEPLLFQVAGPNLRNLLEEPNLSDRSPIIKETLGSLRTRYLEQAKITGAGDVPYWKIKPTLEFRAVSYMRGGREQVFLAMTRRLYQRHRQFVERRAGNLGYGLVELRS